MTTSNLRATSSRGILVAACATWPSLCFAQVPAKAAPEAKAPADTPAAEGAAGASTATGEAATTEGNGTLNAETGTAPATEVELARNDASEGEPLPALPPEGLPLPVYVPPDAEPKPKAESAGSGAPGAPQLETGDSILYSGYLPGYRRHFALGAGPYDPMVGSLPGPTTPGYGAPVPPNEWTFSFNGFMNVSAQVSFDERPLPEEGQGETVTHVLPQTLDNYQFFTSVNAVPGNWVSLRFRYGTSKVSTNVSFDTYNPTAPSSYYQMGSQFFINNAYLEFAPGAVHGVNLVFRAGRQAVQYGQLGQYGNGMYANPMTASIQGVGLNTRADYSLTDDWQLEFAHDLMMARDGTIPWNVVRNQASGWRRPLWVGSVVHGLHIGANLRTEPRVEFRLHHLIEFAADDRLDRETDESSTRHVDERNVKDGSLSVFGGDVKLLHDTFGVLGASVSYTKAENAFPLRALNTYGGFGEQLTERYLGVPSMGSGSLLVAGINYQASLGRIISYPAQFDGQGRDLTFGLGAHYTRTGTAFDPFDGRHRYKMGADLVYTLFKYAGIALRMDRVVPDHSDPGQTFHVVAPRLVFKSDWFSRETLQIMYAKWFFGDHTRNEGAGERDPARLDDELFALNMNMWW